MSKRKIIKAVIFSALVSVILITSFANPTLAKNQKILDVNEVMMSGP
jgi:hypothetical protein